jgi:hypothetical protein
MGGISSAILAEEYILILCAGILKFQFLVCQHAVIIAGGLTTSLEPDGDFRIQKQEQKRTDIERRDGTRLG